MKPEPKPLFQSSWHVLNTLGMAALILATLAIPLAIVLVWPYNLPFPENFLLARSSVISGNIGNHSVIFLLVLATTWGIVGVQGSRLGGFRALLLDKYGFFFCVLFGLLIAVVHESEWLVVYVLRYGWTPLIIPRYVNGSVYSQWLLWSVLVFPTYFALYRFRRREVVLVLGMSLFYVAWYDLGFPITIDFTGPVLFQVNNLVTNGIEILSWGYACAIGFVAFLVFKAAGPLVRLRRRDRFRRFGFPHGVESDGSPA